MKIILLQSASSQCDPSPRRAAVDMGSEEPGEPRRSPTISIRGQDPKYRKPKRKCRRKELSLVETSMDGFLHLSCTSTEQEYILLLQSDIGMDDNNETTFTTSHCLRGVRESYGQAIAAREDSLGYRAKQAV